MARETSKAISSVLSVDEDFVIALMTLKSERMDFSVISYKASHNKYSYLDLSTDREVAFLTRTGRCFHFLIIMVEL